MPLAVWYWVFYVILLLWGGYWGWRGPAEARWSWGGANLILAILLFIIGLKLMGSPVAG